MCVLRIWKNNFFTIINMIWKQKSMISICFFNVLIWFSFFILLRKNFHLLFIFILDWYTFEINPFLESETFWFHLTFIFDFKSKYNTIGELENREENIFSSDEAEIFFLLYFLSCFLTFSYSLLIACHLH